MNTRPNPLVLPVLIAAVAGLALGWMLRGRIQPPTALAAAAPASVAPAAPADAVPSTPPPADPAWQLATVLEILGAESPEGWRQLQDMIGDLDFEQLVALIPQLRDLPPNQRQAAMFLVSERMGKLDPHAALAFGDTLRDDGAWDGMFRTQGMFRNQIVQQWARHDPEGALAWIGTLPPGEERNVFLGSVATTLAKDSPVSAVKVLESVPHNPGSIATMDGSYSTHGYVYLQWARQDPLAASAAALALPAGPIQQDALKAVAESWAQADPAAALAWVEALPPSPARSSAIEEVAKAWAKVDPVGALAWTLRTDTSPLQLKSLNLFMGWNHRAPEEAWAWLSAQPAGPTRESFMGNFVSTLAATDRARALELFQTELTPANQRMPAIMIAKAWAATDPAAAAAWAAQVADADARGHALREVVAAWSNNDPAATGAWLKSFPAGAERDGLVVQFADQVVAFDPRQAVDWASGLAEPNQRLHALVKHASKWLEVDPSAARAWIESSDLIPLEQKSRLLK